MAPYHFPHESAVHVVEVFDLDGAWTVNSICTNRDKAVRRLHQLLPRYGCDRLRLRPLVPVEAELGRGR